MVLTGKSLNPVNSNVNTESHKIFEIIDSNSKSFTIKRPASGGEVVLEYV